MALKGFAGFRASQRTLRASPLRRRRLFLEPLEDRALLATITVDSAEDAGAIDTVLTLREAISLANGDLPFSDLTTEQRVQVTGGEPGKNQTDTIAFNIGSGLHTIQPTSPLPAITDPVIIDGTTQPGWDGLHPAIELDGSQAGPSNGLFFVVGNNTVKGLVIDRFLFDGIFVNEHGGKQFTGGSVFQDNFIGTDATGTRPRGNGKNGIELVDSPNNTIGGPEADDSNVISGNQRSGIAMNDKLSSGNVVENNLIGTDITGTFPVGNGLHGVILTQFIDPFIGDGYASDNFIGVADSSVPDNVISGNGRDGIFILRGTGNKVRGNSIGVGSFHQGVIGNGTEGDLGGDGVVIYEGSDNVIGGTQPGAGNIIAANVRNGVDIVAGATDLGDIVGTHQSATGNLVQGNVIGTDGFGLFLKGLDFAGLSLPLGNGENGVELRNESDDPTIVVSNNEIGDSDSGNQFSNLISGNIKAGIDFSGARVDGNKVSRNRIGTTSGGDDSLPNGTAGVVLSSDLPDSPGPADNIIGDTDDTLGNLISGNGILNSQHSDVLAGDGVDILDGATRNFVGGNLIGTDRTGLKQLRNTGDGLFIQGAADNTIDGNVIAGNARTGVLITGTNSKNNQLQNNAIGVGKDGVTQLGNAVGVEITRVPGGDGPASGNIIGGTITVDGVEVSLGNIISANAGDGVAIDSGATLNLVVGNTIGTDASGTADLGNGNGVFIYESPGNTVGGTTGAARNVIVNNRLNGVDISGQAATLNKVAGNYIGLGRDGTSAQTNSGSGVLIDDAPVNFIGTGVQGGRNVISGNTGSGIHIQGEHGTSNTVLGNYIGTTADGMVGQPNGLGGIIITARAGSNVIGGPGDLGRNLISGNKSSGVNIDGLGKNALQNNYIGTNAEGSAALANEFDGIRIFNSPDNTIGDGSPEGRNVISGNGAAGITLAARGTIGTSIQGNFVGTDKFAVVALGNDDFGIRLNSLNADLGAPSQTFIFANVLGGNQQGGILLADGTTDAFVAGNDIGHNTGRLADAGDDFDIPNRGFGVVIQDSPANSIGGTEEDLRNVITETEKDAQANPDLGSGHGILITGKNSTGNQVQSNSIFNNEGEGIRIGEGASKNLIGGDEDGSRNVLYDNDDGVLLTGPGTSDNVVAGNRIGIDETGAAVGNRFTGVAVDDVAFGNIIGGTGDKSGNVISANHTHGVFLGDQASDNTVAANKIGTNLNGDVVAGFGNVLAGIDIKDARHNTIGGEVDAARNHIMGNGEGIVIIGANAQENVVEGNTVRNNLGIKTNALRGEGYGVHIDNGASNNQIGGETNADANAILDNSGPGVFIESGMGNAILHNSILHNDGLGIDLAPEGPTPNDPRQSYDSDSGANNLQNAPLLSFATAGGSQRLVGTLESVPLTLFKLEFFDGTHSEIGRDAASEFVLSTRVTTNSSGIAFFDLTLPPGEFAGLFLIATATDPFGNTSEFSNIVQILDDTNGNGIPDGFETAGPNNGDGNNDGVADSQEANVASFPTVVTGAYVTLAAPEGKRLVNVRTAANPSPDDAPPQADFPLGFFSFDVTGVEPGGRVDVNVFLPAGSAPHDYYRYGPTPDNSQPHWYDWLWDGQPGHPGAEINDNLVVLHFVDGGLGDDDLTANGTIADFGGPGFADSFTVINTNDSGLGSLRQAILNANAGSGANQITFSIHRPGPQTIHLLSPLPDITDFVTIDGATQPGYTGKPLIELDGSQAGSAADGLTLAAGSSTVKGLVINRFAADGIRVESDEDDIEGNFIGTDASGAIARGNGGFGIEIDNGGFSQVGSAAPNGRNIISANATGGIFIHGANATDNNLSDNLIGVQADGISPLGNGGPGVLLDQNAGNNHVGSGDSLQSNTIAFNAGIGVDVMSGQGNAVQANSVFSNGGLGIDRIGDGVTANDASDNDGLQNFPVLTHVASYGGRTYVTGTLMSTPSASFILEFYASPAADPSGFGEGRSLLASLSATTDATGQAAFNLNWEKSVAPGSFIAATATGANGTSEFSAAAEVRATETLVFTVNTADDVNDAVPDAAHLSLREAILAANSHPGQDVIHFALPNLHRTIAPLSQLPDVTDPVIIDGTSQAGYAGLPLVELDGSNAGIADGLRITGGGSVVRGLVINRFQMSFDDNHPGSGIVLAGLGGNRIEGNFLGTDVTGTNALPNGFADVSIEDSPDNVIGGTTAAARNLMLRVFLQDSGASGNQVEGNYIGTDLTGTVFLPGGFFSTGIDIVSASSNTIGGLQAGAGNLIAGSLQIAAGSSNVVQGNLIGTDVTGTRLLLGGVEIASIASSNLIGGDTVAARNIIAGGVHIGGVATHNRLEGNFIGTDVTGIKALAKSGGSAGVNIEGAFNTIGGTAPGEGNLISGNQDDGIVLTGSAHDNVILGNYIGTDITGTKALGNGDLVLTGSGGTGILCQGFFNTIGSSAPGAGNVISGNERGGMSVAGFGGNMVQGNFIGTDRTGTAALGNGSFVAGDGVDVTASGLEHVPGMRPDIIGGLNPGDGNVIAANGGSGISLSSKGTIVRGNLIGVDVTGRRPLGNGGDGIDVVGSPNNVIGGAGPGAGNIIAANGGDGIRINDTSVALDRQFLPVYTTGILIQGNRIGTDATGTLPLGNGGDGISAADPYALHNNVIIGGTVPDAGNVVAYNGGRGVNVLFGSGNTVRANGIFANGDLGLVTSINGTLSTYAEQRGLNTSASGSTPVLASAVFDAQGTVITGSISGTPFTRYDIDFFSNDTFDASGFGEGQRSLQSISVLVDDSESAHFELSLDEAVPVGQWITATATPETPDGNTSQFSHAIPVAASATASSIEFTAPTYVVTENGGTAVVTVTRTGSTAGTATVHYATSDGSGVAGTNFTAQSGTLTFADGEGTKTLSILILDDGDLDGSKAFRIVLSSPTGAGLGSIPSAAITIADDDTAGQIQFATAANTIDRTVGPGDVFEVTRTGSSKGRVSVDYRVTGGTAIGVVTAPSPKAPPIDADYVDADGTVTFEDGQTTAQIQVTRVLNLINGDLSRPVYKGPRTIEMTLGNPTGGAVMGAITKSTLTIQDEEDRSGAFTVSGQTSAYEKDGSVFIFIGRIGNLFSVQTVHYTTVDGTAQAGQNYVARSGTLTFNAREASKFITIPILDDGIVDDPGTFQVTIDSPVGGAFVFPGFDKWSVQILDSDDHAPQPGKFVVVPASPQSQGMVTVHENIGLATINVERLDGSDGFTTVDYATSDGTATAGQDYTFTTGTLTFGPGETFKSFTVPITSNNVAEGDETFFVTLSNPSGGASLGSGDIDGQQFENPTPVVIYETPGEFDFTATDYQVAENNAAFTVTVQFTAFPDPQLLADPNGRQSSLATVDYSIARGTATPEEDYTPISGTVRIDGASFMLTIPILNDLLVESDETLFVTLSNPTGGTILGPHSTAKLTILDEDSNRFQDITPPNISGAPDRPPNADWWYGAPVTVTFTASDDGSGLASVTPPATISTEGPNQSVAGTATDNAGNSASTAVGGISIDLTKPDTTASIVSGTLGDNGWYQTEVRVGLTASDNLSGVKNTLFQIDGGAQQIYAGAPVPISGDLVHTITFWSVDKAGNTERLESLTVKIDKTPPTISGSTDRPANAEGWYNGAVTVSFTASDALSGLASVSDPFTLSTAGANGSVTGTATDKAGNSARATVSNVNIDLTKPFTTASVVSGTLGFNGWYTSDVAVRLSANDDLSGVKSTFYRFDGGPQQTYAGTPLIVSGDLVHAIIFWSVDKAGNTERVEGFTVKIDKTPPEITLSPPTAAGAAGGSIFYTVSYSDAHFQSSDLAPANVHLISTGSATGTLSFDSSTGTSRTVTVSSISGQGSLAIAVDAGSAIDEAGNVAASGIGAPFDVGIGNAFILLLDPSGMGVLTATGNANLVVSGNGSVIINSNNAAAAVVTGNAIVAADEIDVSGKPGTRISGHGAFRGAIHSGVAPTPDPLASLPVPQRSTTTFSAINYTGSSPLTLKPGTYVGGIHISGQGNVTLLPGIYYLEGGGFTVSGKGKITGSGVMIYNAPAKASDTIAIAGQGAVTFTPSSTGIYQGVTIFQDRRASAPLNVTGNGAISITGTIYAASATLNVTGNGGLDAHGQPLDTIGSEYVIDDLVVSGNGSIGIASAAAAHNLALASGEGQTKGIASPSSAEANASASGNGLSALPIQFGSRHVLHNDLNSVDVDGDGLLAPIDALDVINYLNGKRPVQVGLLSNGPGDLYCDVDDDGTVAPIDALIVINSLNAQSRSGSTADAGEGEQAAVIPAAQHADDLLTLLALDVLSHPGRRMS